MAPAIEVLELEKVYVSGERAVAGVSFQVDPGEIFGFLGPNGAGKTTTISMLCTLLRPTSGTARVAGHDVVADRSEVRRAIGLVFQDRTLDEHLSAEQNLRFHAYAYGVPRAVYQQRIPELLRLVGLWDRRRDHVAAFSGGMKRRLEIARGLLHRPRVLFLDEPTLGLDPQTRRYIWDYIAELRRREGVTVFLTTHYMDEAEACDRIAIIDHGRILALDTPERLKDVLGGDVVSLRAVDTAAAVRTLGHNYAVTPEVHGERISFAVLHGEESSCPTSSRRSRFDCSRSGCTAPPWMTCSSTSPAGPSASSRPTSGTSCATWRRGHGEEVHEDGDLPRRLGNRLPGAAAHPGR